MYVLPEQLAQTKHQLREQFPKGCRVRACGAEYQVCGLRVTTRHKIAFALNGHPIASEEICDYNIKIVVENQEGNKRTLDPTWIQGFEHEPRGPSPLQQQEELS